MIYTTKMVKSYIKLKEDFLGDKLVIYDQNGNEVGTVLEKVMTLLPKFEIYKNNEYIGCLSKELSFFTGSDASIFIGQVKHLEFDLIRNQSH